MSFLLINKPEGWTSFDVVAVVRKKVRSGSVILSEVKDPLNQNKRDSSVAKLPQNDRRLRVGHAGTLDPFATGLLIVAIGREDTKKLDEFKKLPKTYITTIKLGATSNTYDKTGKITTCHSERSKESLSNKTEGILRLAQDDKPLMIPLLEEVNKILKTFTGKQKQIPPMFSAKKINGKRLYDLARKGIEVERQPNEIEIYSLELLDYTWPILKVEVQCSAGTYIRSLAHDIGQKIGTGAYCEELKRTQIGEYLLTNAINIKDLK